MRGSRAPSAGAQRYQRDNTALRDEVESLRARLASTQADHVEAQTRSIVQGYKLDALREFIEGHQYEVHYAIYDGLLEILDASAVNIGSISDRLNA